MFSIFNVFGDMMVLDRVSIHRYQEAATVYTLSFSKQSISGIVMVSGRILEGTSIIL